LRTNYILNAIAASEIHVAAFYYKKGAYIAAINRVQYALNEFKDVPALEEGLRILINSYAALGMDDLRTDTQKIFDRTYGVGTFHLKASDIQDKPKQWWRFW
jgi:outer membrane protein assembly factor BamD